MAVFDVAADMTAIQKHAKQVRTDPAKWLPWNYQEQLTSPPADTG